MHDIEPFLTGDTYMFLRRINDLRFLELNILSFSLLKLSIIISYIRNGTILAPRRCI